MVSSFLISRREKKQRICSCVCHTWETASTDTQEQGEKWQERRAGVISTERVCSLCSSRSPLHRLQAHPCKVERIPLGSRTLIRKSVDVLLWPLLLWSSRSATVLLLYTNLKAAVRKLWVEKGHAAAYPACIITLKARCVPAKHGPHMRSPWKFSAL